MGGRYDNKMGKALACNGFGELRRLGELGRRGRLGRLQGSSGQIPLQPGVPSASLPNDEVTRRR